MKTTILLQMLAGITGQVLHKCDDVSAVYTANACCTDSTASLTSSMHLAPLNPHRVTAVVRGTTYSLSAINATYVQRWRDLLKGAEVSTPTLPGNAVYNSIVYDTMTFEAYSYTDFTKHHLLLEGGIFNGEWKRLAKEALGVEGDTILDDVGWSVKEVRIIANDKAAADQYYYTDSFNVMPTNYFFANKTLAGGFQSFGWTFSVQEGNGWRF